MTPDVEAEFLEAIKELEAKGVCGFTGDCGFMMFFQGLARRNTHKPVFMSALAQLPAVTCAYAQHEQILIMTANGHTLEPMRDLIRDECGVDTQLKRFHVVGCEDVDGFEAVAEGKKVDVAKCTPGIVKKAQDAIKMYPQSRAILLECTELPPYADAIRHATGLPVYDAITNCDFFVMGY
jgi:Asp/Glu/hydantoin racemase